MMMMTTMMIKMTSVCRLSTFTAALLHLSETLLFHSCIDGSGDDVDKSDKNKRDADEASDSSAHEKVEGAKDRHNFGDLGGAYVGCQEGLVCTPVSIGKSECLPENPDGN